MNYTRPDIVYSINKLSRFTSNPSMDYWKTIKKDAQIFEAHLRP
jgi:hypothetical protein